MITVDPVVVMPDIASNSASVKFMSSSENTNGSAANSVIATQLAVVIMKAWRMVSLRPRTLEVSAMVTPTKKVVAAATANTCQSG